MTTQLLPATQTQALTLAAQPAPFTFEPATSAVLVVDMQSKQPTAEARWLYP